VAAGGGWIVVHARRDRARSEALVAATSMRPAASCEHAEVEGESWCGGGSVRRACQAGKYTIDFIENASASRRFSKVGTRGVRPRVTFARSARA